MTGVKLHDYYTSLIEFSIFRDEFARRLLTNLVEFTLWADKISPLAVPLIQTAC